jgi:hypothetical protein
MSSIDTCARCGGGFHCGANDADACACTTLTLHPDTLADLARRYAGCLCLGCLRTIAADHEKAGLVSRPAGFDAATPTGDQSLR